MMESPRPMSPIREVTPSEQPDAADLHIWHDFLLEHRVKENFTDSILKYLPELVRKLPVLMICFAEEPYNASDSLIVDLLLVLMSGRFNYFSKDYYSDLSIIWARGLTTKAQGPRATAIYEKIARQAAPFVARLEPSPIDPPPRPYAEKEIATRIYDFICEEHSTLERQGVIQGKLESTTPTKPQRRPDESQLLGRQNSRPQTAAPSRNGPPSGKPKIPPEWQKPMRPIVPQVEAMKSRLRKAHAEGRWAEQYQHEDNSVKAMAEELMAIRLSLGEVRGPTFPFRRSQVHKDDS
ncbi:hypothetical protein F4779DRAFT_621247 [Xylariaceae sp. FL0662B]|nr:hypothetical protein F4779DRAFT_621247 [Xylariaceae sp. FL0662B]